MKMFTILIGSHSLAQGVLDRVEKGIAYVNIGSDAEPKLISGKPVAPLAVSGCR